MLHLVRRKSIFPNIITCRTSNQPRQAGDRPLSISRMLDVGGMPSASNDRTLIRTVNASKNSKLQAVAFDFEILIKAPTSNTGSGEGANKTMVPTGVSTGSSLKIDTRPTVDVDQINHVTSLLKVDINSHTPSFKNPYKEPIISLNNNKMAAPTAPTTASIPSPSSKPQLPKSAPYQDIRAKYAKKLQGGLAGIDLAKSQLEDTLAKGDAAGHLAARQIAIQQSNVSRTLSGSRWMANAAASKLLTYLTHRSIRVALLPSPQRVGSSHGQKEEQQWMHDFQTQLKDVVIDAVVPSLTDADHSTITTALQDGVLKELAMSDPTVVLVVCDRDDYLKAAKELGMLTCRLQPKNARRGNITAHYTASSVEDVQEIVNEINGISFNVVLNR
jgi:hypothetical protein